ncbi:MAG: aldolase/citrate lyase family protein [Solirubrobacteraceae bacterium]
MRLNRSQQLLDRADGGQTLRGTVLSSADPVLAELVATSFDFVWIDLEHSALTIRDLQTLTIAVQASDCAALVRLPHAGSDLLTAVLDAGVDGVVAPRVSCARQAQELVTSLAYPPGGCRGFAPRRGNAFGRSQATGAHSPRLISIAQIETSESLGNLHEIAAVQDLDWLLVGLADLSFELGAPLDPQAPQMRAAVKRVREAAQRSGVRFGLAASGGKEALARLLTPHVSMLLYSSDARLYAEAIAGAERTTTAAIGRAAVDSTGR